MRLSYVLPLVALGLASCGGPDPAEEAHETLDIIFRALKRSDVEGALMLYSPSFFQSTPRQQWLQQLQGIHGSLGPVQSFEILDTVSEKRKVPTPGVYVGFTCKVYYQRGWLNEDIVLVRPEGLQAFTISGHRITAPQQAPQVQAQQQPQGIMPPPSQTQPTQPVKPPAPAQPGQPVQPAPGAAPPAAPQTPPVPQVPTAPQVPPVAPVTPQAPPAPQAVPQAGLATPQAPPPVAPKTPQDSKPPSAPPPVQ